MDIDLKKVHLNGKADDDDFAYIMLPKEVGGGVGRLRRWLDGCGPQHMRGKSTTLRI